MEKQKLKFEMIQLRAPYVMVREGMFPKGTDRHTSSRYSVLKPYKLSLQKCAQESDGFDFSDDNNATCLIQKLPVGGSGKSARRLTWVLFGYTRQNFVSKHFIVSGRLYSGVVSTEKGMQRGMSSSSMLNLCSLHRRCYRASLERLSKHRTSTTWL